MYITSYTHDTPNLMHIIITIAQREREREKSPYLIHLDTYHVSYRVGIAKNQLRLASRMPCTKSPSPTYTQYHTRTQPAEHTLVKPTIVQQIYISLSLSLTGWVRFIFLCFLPCACPLGYQMLDSPHPTPQSNRQRYRVITSCS